MTAPFQGLRPVARATSGSCKRTRRSSAAVLKFTRAMRSRTRTPTCYVRVGARAGAKEGEGPAETLRQRKVAVARSQLPLAL